MSALIVATPSRAYASDGFLGGLQDLVGVREDVGDVDYEREYIESYDSGLRADPPDPGTNELVEIEEGQEIQAVVNAANTVPYQSNSGTVGLSLFEMTRVMVMANRSNWLGSNLWTLYGSIAVGLVFAWWGVRKCINMVMGAFRKGSMNV